MSNFAWIVILVVILTLLGSGTLFFITVKYYWGIRGTPPPTREARKRIREEEIRLRARQIEHSEQNRWTTRSDDFFDNRKGTPKT